MYVYTHTHIWLEADLATVAPSPLLIPEGLNTMQ